MKRLLLILVVFIVVGSLASSRTARAALPIVDIQAPPYNMACDGSDEHAALQLLASNLQSSIGGQQVLFPSNRNCASSLEIDFNVVNTSLIGAANGATLLLLPYIQFNGSISGTTLTVPNSSIVGAGLPVKGEIIADASGSVASGTTIISTGTVSGNNITYTVNTSQTVASEAMNVGNSGTDFITFGKNLGYGYNNEVSHLAIQRQDGIATFTGSIAASSTTLSVTTGLSNAIYPGMSVGGAGIGSNVTVVSPSTCSTSTPCSCSTSMPCYYTLNSAPASGVPSENMRAGNGPTSGVALHLYAQGPFRSNNLAIDGFFTSVQCESCQESHFYDLETQQGQAWANQVPGSIGVNITQFNGVNPSGITLTDPSIGGIQQWQTVETGLNVSAADGVYVFGGHIGNDTYDVKLQPLVNGGIVQSILLSSVYFDGTNHVGGRGLYIPPFTGSKQGVTQVAINGGVTNSHIIAGFDIEAPVTGVSITNTQSLFEQGFFVNAPNVNSISVTGNTIIAAQLGNTAYPAIAVGTTTNNVPSATVSTNTISSMPSCLVVYATASIISGNNYGTCTSNTPSDNIGAVTVNGYLSVRGSANFTGGVVSNALISNGNVSATNGQIAGASLASQSGSSTAVPGMTGTATISGCTLTYTNGLVTGKSGSC